MQSQIQRTGEFRLNIEKLGNLENSEKTAILKPYEFYSVFQCSDQSEVKKAIFIKSSSRKVRINPREVTFTSHLSNSSLLDVS